MKQHDKTREMPDDGFEKADEAIVDLYWQRDEMAIRETDRKYGKYLFTIAYNMLHDRQDCEECVDDTYIGAWNSIPPTRPQFLQVFLSKITRNIAVNCYKKKTAEKRIPSELTLSLDELRENINYSAFADDDYATHELGRIINRYIDTLTDRQEFIFVCRYYYSDRIADIATMLRVSENTVHRELATIRQGLRERLEKEGYSL